MRFLRRTFLFFLVLALAGCSAANSTQPASSPEAPLITAAPTSPLAGTATAAGCSALTGTVTQVQIDSDTLGGDFTFSVYLPPCYDADHEGGYPIIYLFHGQNMDNTTWPSLGITDAADSRITAGAVSFIMVFPYEERDWDNVAESKFGDAFIDDLMPYVESHYAVCTERACRAIGGMSRGGGWAMHIALTHFDMFGSIGAHSIAYFAGDLYRVQNLLQKHAAEDFPRIYIDRGEDDYLHETIDQYEANLTATDVAHEYHVSPGSHDQDYWRSQVENYLDWYIEGLLE